VRENITNVFGARMLNSLEPLHLTLEIDVRLVGGTQSTQTIEVVGYMSKSAQGEGRSSSDRQFFYINSRPCVQPKVVFAQRVLKDRLPVRLTRYIDRIITTNIHSSSSILDWRQVKDCSDVTDSRDVRFKSDSGQTNHFPSRGTISSQGVERTPAQFSTEHRTN